MVEDGEEYINHIQQVFFSNNNESQTQQTATQRQNAGYDSLLFGQSQSSPFSKQGSHLPGDSSLIHPSNQEPVEKPSPNYNSLIVHSKAEGDLDDYMEQPTVVINPYKRKNKNYII